MKKLVNDGRDSRHNGWKAVKLLPNVRKFRIEISGLDKLFAVFNIKKHTKPKIRFEPHENKPLNRYIQHQFRRMDSLAKTQPLAF
jgi:hypothetical protein